MRSQIIQNISWSNNLLIIIPLLLLALLLMQPASAELPRDEVFRLITEGLQKFDCGSYEDCERIFSNAMRLSASNNLEASNIDAHGWLVRTYSAQKRFVKAEISCNDKIKELERLHKRPHYLVQELCFLASVLNKEGKDADSEKNYEEALKLSKDKDCDSYYCVGPLVGLGTLSFQRNNLEQAEKYWEEALSYTEGSNYDFRGRANVISGLSTIYEKLGKQNKIEDLFKSVITSYRRNDLLDSESFANILQKYALLMVRSQRWADAEPLLREANEIYQRYGNRTNQAESCHDEYMIVLTKLGKKAP